MNVVALKFFDAAGLELGTHLYRVRTPPAPDYLPEIAVDEIDEEVADEVDLQLALLAKPDNQACSEG